MALMGGGIMITLDHYGGRRMETIFLTIYGPPKTAFSVLNNESVCLLSLCGYVREGCRCVAVCVRVVDVWLCA